MDLTLSPEYAAFRDQVAETLKANAHLAPGPDDKGLKHPKRLAWQEFLIREGLTARTIPTEYGGYGAEPDILKSRIIAEEFARSGVPRPLAGQGISMLVPTLLELGTPEQKEAYIERTLKGELIWCQGYSEPGAGSDLAALRTRARRLKRRHDIGLVIVDYLQLLQGSGRASDNRVNEISEISRGLKTLAKELHVPVIALSQLSRQVEQREDKRPQLSDLRESGSIEQDADMVWFIYRAEYYHNALKPDTPDETSSEEVRMKYAEWEARHLELVNKATLIVAKQRHGSTGNVPLLFHSEFTKFSSPEIRHYEDYE